VEQLKGKPAKKRRRKRAAFSRDTRLALNTIRQSVDMAMKTGLDITTDEREHEQYIEFVIKIPKN
jgi:ParB family transcriptional regulator, chromosome partitioning protein